MGEGGGAMSHVSWCCRSIERGVCVAWEDAKIGVKIHQ